MIKKESLNRRDFLKGIAVAGAAVAFPTIIPASARGADGKVAPSNRIVMGSIGVGSMGMGDLDAFLNKPEVQIVAVCDPDRDHAEAAKRKVDAFYGNNNCVVYKDFRQMIARGDLDAVHTATPDHWHSIIAVAAARAGLDIFGQKPLARSIREGRAIVNAVERYGRVWQTGSWQRSSSEFHRACELVRNGRIGKIKYIEVVLPYGPTCGPMPKAPLPEALDWNLWLGPAPWIDYRPFDWDPNNRCHYQWRWLQDYSGGQLTDWAGHHIDIAHWGMGLDSTGPVEIQGAGEYPKEGLYNTVCGYQFDCKYADGLTMRVMDDRRQPMGTTWFGEKGKIYVTRGGLEAHPASVLKEVIGPDEIQLYESKDHTQNFLDCIKTRQLTITPVETALRSISVGLLGEIAMLTGRKIRWNPETEQILDDPAASALLGRSYREPWHTYSI